MNNVTLAIAALLLSCVVMVVSADEDCAFRADRSAQAATDGITRVEVRAGAGDLTVTGESARRTLDVSGVACASKEAQLEDVQVRLERAGDTLVLEAQPPDNTLSLRKWFFSGQPHLHLTVRLPAGLAVDIEDTSGNVRLANVGPTRMQDGSGDLEIDNVKGELSVKDGSGNVTIRKIQGPVRIEDGSGDFTIAQIVGEVIVAADGSGSMEIADVQGNVTIGNDGSGDIGIERVSGSVKIEDDGSGNIRVAVVEHDVTIEGDGSGDINVQDVRGDFSVMAAGSGGVWHEGVRGNVRLASEEIQSEQPSEQSEASEELEVER
jgi:hypothetical protein